MNEIKRLNKQVIYNNLTYYFQMKNPPKRFISFTALLSLLRSIKYGSINLEKERSKQ